MYVITCTPLVQYALGIDKVATFQVLRKPMLEHEHSILNWYKYRYDTGLQIYGGPGSLSHDFKIWPITFQGSGPT